MLEGDEGPRISLSRLALLLKKLPSQILEEPWEHIEDLMAVLRGEQDVAEFKKGKIDE